MSKSEIVTTLQEQFDQSGIFAPRFDVDSPFVADYFGIWMVHDETFRGLVQRANGTDLHFHMGNEVRQEQVQQRVGRQRELSIDRDGIAHFAISGPMMKRVPSMSDGTSYVLLRQGLRQARNDPDVKGAILYMDTPGGTANGNEDLVKEVRSFAATKPIYAFIEDMTASAGVSIASQATKRFANVETAIYGAMGTYAVVQDLSGAAEQIGVKVHVIRAGDFKGAGTPGTEITEEQLSEIQRIVNRLNENYLQLIANGLGRTVESIRSLADGRAMFASDAVTNGLIDGVQSIDETRAQLRDAVSRQTSQLTTPRSDEQMSNPATLQELKTTFPNSSADWREEQILAERDLSQAAIEYGKHVEQQAAAAKEAHEKEIEELKNSAPAAPPASAGHQPLTLGALNQSDVTDTSGDPIQDFKAAVALRCPPGASFDQRMAAVSAVAQANPELHQAYIAATNRDKGPRVNRLVQEKYAEV